MVGFYERLSLVSERQGDSMSFECDCSCDDSTDWPTFYTESFHKAEKEHLCCECGENVKPGKEYHKAVGVWGRDFITFKTCIPCYHIREYYCSQGYTFGGLRDQISSCLGFNYLVKEED